MLKHCSFQNMYFFFEILYFSLSRIVQHQNGENWSANQGPNGELFWPYSWGGRFQMVPQAEVCHPYTNLQIFVNTNPIYNLLALFMSTYENANIVVFIYIQYFCHHLLLASKLGIKQNPFYSKEFCSPVIKSFAIKQL